MSRLAGIRAHWISRIGAVADKTILRRPQQGVHHRLQHRGDGERAAGVGGY